jgi:hypothetical protein
MTASAPKRSAILNEAVLAASQPKGRTAAKTENAAFADIQANPFFSAMFDQSKSLSEKKAAVTQLTVSTLDSKQDRANIAAFEQFREWLSAQQTELAERIIALTNVDSMAELQAILKDMNTDLINFEDKMNPLMAIIESIHYLRTNDLMGDAFRDIQREKEEEAKRLADLEQARLDLAEQDAAIARARSVKAEAQTKRSFFGMGGMTKDAVIEQSKAEDAINDAQRAKSELEARIASLNAPKVIADNDEVAAHKARLKELLDLSKEDNQGKMVGLRDSAVQFITTAKERTGSLRGQFETLAAQISTAEESNGHMIKVYAVLNDGVKDAVTANAEIRVGLEQPGENEGNIEEMTRREKLRTLDTHVGQLTRAQSETMSSYGTLNQQAIRINTMRGATEQQIQTARLINTEGVAATADRLATVLTAVSGAALGEAAEAAKDTLNRMRLSTGAIAASEVIRVAMGTAAMGGQLETVFQELESIREVQQTATGITRNAMLDIQERMAEVKASAEAAKRDLEAHIAAASTVGAETAPAAAAGSKPSIGSGFPQI